MKSVHADSPQLTTQDFTTGTAPERFPTPTVPLLLNELSTTTLAFFDRSGGLSDVTGFTLPHHTIVHDQEPHRQPNRTSSSFVSMLIWHRH